MYIYIYIYIYMCVCVCVCVCVCMYVSKNIELCIEDILRANAASHTLILILFL